ncbi:MAG TPA: HD domain-containing protein [Solirubrobacteraceae bacterium]
MSATDGDPLDLARATLAGRQAWLVGGAVRDRVRGHAGATDFDIVIDGEPREAARALARAASGQRASAFALSEEWGGWRVVSQAGGWQIDVERLRGGSLEDDLALRDFTVNAIAEPLGDPASGSGELIDPLGGLGDLERRRLRAAGPRAFPDDPLRVLRLVRIAIELDLEPTRQTAVEAAAHAGALRAVSPERVFMELRRIVATPRARKGIELMREIGATAVVLPELDALRGVQQSHFHHLDVYDHTLEVLDQTIALSADPVAIAPSVISEEHASQLATVLAEPLADELTRGEALRWGALLHDIAKPLTRAVSAQDGPAGERRVTFIDHDRRGAELAQEILGRLRASSRLGMHVAALVRNHLRLGFLVHQPQPLARRAVFAYLRACEPVEVDVTLLSVADRLATRGARSGEAIDAHLRLARTVLGAALRWHSEGPPDALVRGDELARELDIAPGPRLGELLEELAKACYAGEIATHNEALAYARAVLASSVDRTPKMGRA